VSDASPVSSGYVLGERLGSGGTATVYRARRGAEEVALKILHPHLARDEAVRQRFVREVAIARTLDHPAIVRVWDLVWWEGSAALVMELCPGGSLAGRRSSGVEEVVRIATDVAGALSAAHARGVVHRDLKPQNVLLGAQGGWKVCDFGSAGVQDSVGLTTSSLLMAAPQYVAPEVFAGHPPDPRADLYALGAILFELVTGRPPRAGILPSGRSGGDAVDRRGLDAALPGWLSTLILALLAPVDRRPPDAPTVLRALRRLEGSPPVALKRCLFCGASIPAATPVCLHCGEEELALRPPGVGEGWYVALRRVSEQASTLQAVAELLRAVSGDAGFELDVMIGDARMYSRQEQKRKSRLPVRMADGLSEMDAQRLVRILDGMKVKATAHPMRATRRVKRGPLIRARAGAVLVPEASDFLSMGTAAVKALEEPWMRSLASRLLGAIYALEDRAGGHELRDVLRPSCVALRAVAERSVRDLGASAAMLRGIDRSALYAEVARAGLDPGGGAQGEERQSAGARALEALGKHEAAELAQTRLVTRLLHWSGLVEELTRSLETGGSERSALDSALAELEAELGQRPCTR